MNNRQLCQPLLHCTVDLKELNSCTRPYCFCNCTIKTSIRICILVSWYTCRQSIAIFDMYCTSLSTFWYSNTITYMIKMLTMTNAMKLFIHNGVLSLFGGGLSKFVCLWKCKITTKLQIQYLCTTGVVCRRTTSSLITIQISTKLLKSYFFHVTW